MKNVLILSASSRRHGNSDILCCQFAKGGEGVWQKGKVESTRAMQEAYQTGKMLDT